MLKNCRRCAFIAGLLMSVTNASTTPASDDRPVVSVQTDDANASENGPDNGTFIVARSGHLSQPLTVYFNLTGDAENSIDYTTVAEYVTFPPGDAAITVTVVPILDDDDDDNETVELVLLEHSEYRVHPGTASVTINDHAPVPEVNIVVQRQQNGVLRYTVSRDIIGPRPALEVFLTIDGTAIPNQDYTLDPRVQFDNDSGMYKIVIPPGRLTADFTVTPTRR